MAKNIKAKIYMVGSTAGVEVEVEDKEKFLEELRNYLQRMIFICTQMKMVK